MSNKDNHQVAVNSSKQITPQRLVNCFRKWITDWADLWNCPELMDCSIELSSRMTRSLGRAHPASKMIRLNSGLLIGTKSNQLKEVLCHEATHLAVFCKFGSLVKPHRSEWKRLVGEAGFDAKPAQAAEVKEGQIYQKHETKAIYLHTCLTCGSSRIAKKPMSIWRCFKCRDDGLEGTLQITFQPVRAVNRE